MSLGAYVVGSVLTIAEIAALVLFAKAVRRRWLSEWGGASAWLAEAIAGLGLLMAVSLCLGSVGLFRRWVVAAVLVAVGAVAAWPLSHALPLTSEPRREPVRRPAGSEPRWHLLPAVLAILAASVTWGMRTAGAYRRGLHDGDTLWYHAPFAARFLQSGWVTQILHVNGDALVSYFPANAEIVQAWSMLPFQRDVLSPALNLAWLALLALGCWCVGAPTGRGLFGLTVAAVLAGTPLLSATQAGTARNDVAGLALLAAAVALLVQPGQRRAALVLAGTATGLAIGIKSSLLAPGLLILLVGVIASALPPASPGRVAGRRGGRWRGALAFAAPAVVLGGYWYVRNWVRAGNPLPQLALHLGPLQLRRAIPRAALQPSLADRLSATGWWSNMVEPGLSNLLGPLWWLLLVAAALSAGVGLVVFASRIRNGSRADAGSRDRRLFGALLAATAVAAAMAYVMSPNGAPEVVSSPLASTIFGLNFRYALPAVLLGLLVVPATAGLAWAADGLIVALGAISVTQFFGDKTRKGWEFGIAAGDVAPGLAGAAGVLVLAAGIAWMRWSANRRPAASALGDRRRRSLRWSGGAAALVLAVAGGRALTVRYLRGRFAGPPPIPAAALWPFGNSIDHAHIAVVGDFFEYPYVGATLSNRVSYLGVTRDGVFRPAPTCAAWRQALRDAGVDYAVVTHPLFTKQEGGSFSAWTDSLPGSRVVRQARAGAVYRIPQTVTDRGCAEHAPQ